MCKAVCTAGECARRCSKRLLPSLAINRADISHACVTNSERWGQGVFSWHASEADARHNAGITGGVVASVSYVDGEVQIPREANEALWGPGGALKL